MTPRVLVVDDSATVRQYHGTALRQAGFSVLEAANGLEAVEASLSEAFDLYVVDVNMPKMDGYTCVRKLRKEKGSASAAILMISTEERAADAARAYAAGANLYLIKPVAPERLVRVAQLLTTAPAEVGTVGTGVTGVTGETDR